MLIEYRLEFQASGLTITQRIDMDGSAPPAKTDTPIDAQVKPDAPVNKPLAQPAIQGAELPEHINQIFLVYPPLPYVGDVPLTRLMRSCRAKPHV